MAGNENGGELLQDAVCRTLAIEMLDGKWPAGESLTLEDVQNRFGISRTVAREVAKTLESMGAVTVRRRVGLVARPFSDWQALNHQVIEWRLHSTQRERQLSSLTELRLAVEPAAAASAARLASIDVKAKFPVYAAQMRQIAESNEEGAAGLTKFHDLDVEFHTLILRESGNELFHRAARPCGTRQIPDEAEAGRARRARCGRRRDSEGRSGTCAQGHVRHRRRSGPRAQLLLKPVATGVEPPDSRSNHRFASTV